MAPGPTIEVNGTPRPCVVVALTGAPGNEALVRRAARRASRRGAELLGVHIRGVEPPDDLAARLDELRAMVVAYGGRYHELVDADVVRGLVRFARQEGASELLLGASRRSRWERVTRGAIDRRVSGAVGPTGVLVLDRAGIAPSGRRGRATRGPWPVLPRHTVVSWLLAPVLLAALTSLLTRVRGSVNLAAALLLYLLLVVFLAVIGGRVLALVSAASAFVLATWWLTPPLHTWKIARADNVVALVAFVAVAAVASTLVSLTRARSADAAYARAHAESLARLSATFAEPDVLGAVVSHLRSTFGFEAVSVLRRVDGGWLIEASAGQVPPASPDGAAFVHEVSPEIVLVGVGRRVSGDDRQVLRVFSLHLAAAIERAALAAEAARAATLESTNALRTALLQSLSHDLRTPLAAIKLNVTNLRDREIVWSVADQDEFLAAIEDQTDRLTRLVTNLVDLGRIQTGALRPAVRAVSLEEVVPAAVRSVAPPDVNVDIDLPPGLPEAAVDPALLERAVANVVANALRHAPAGSAVAVGARALDDMLRIEVVDHGPGIAPDQRDVVLRPFHRIDDAVDESGIGLGLAITDGFLRAMDGTLSFHDTVGGGCTARLVVPLAAHRPAALGEAG